MDKMNGTENRAEIEQLSIKFGKGLAEPFTARDGTEYIQKRAACTARNNSEFCFHAKVKRPSCTGFFF